MIKESTKKTIIIPCQFLGSCYRYAIYFLGKVMWEANENYQKRSTRNRLFYKSAQGKKHFSIPLKSGKNQQLNIQNIEISYEENWTKDFYQIMITNYSNAPYIDYYLEDITNIINKRHQYLWKLNLELHHLILQKLGINQTTLFTQTWNKNYPTDVLDYRSKQIQLQKVMKYPQLFEEKGINFISDLTIIDLLFCCGPEARLYLKELAKEIIIP